MVVNYISGLVFVALLFVGVVITGLVSMVNPVWGMVVGVLWIRKIIQFDF